MFRLALAIAALITLAPIEAVASSCYAFVQDLRRDMNVHYARIQPVAARSVEITYVAHSAFRIETERGVTIVTDYFGTAGRDSEGTSIIPDVVTMNHAHITHWDPSPDERINYVLRGWDHDGKGPADYKLTVLDVVIRNVTTDIRGWNEPEKDGNSIFIFEVADLCIGHLGHLHHVPTEDQFARIGRLDIVMAPVDGSLTLNLKDMIGIMKRLKARIVLPMHYWGAGTLQQFLEGMKDDFQIQILDSPTFTVSYDGLPGRPTIMVPTLDPTLDPNFGLD